MENLVCKHCGCTEYTTAVKGIHTGAYCKQCGKWIKWLSHSGQPTKKSATNAVSACTVQRNTPQVVKGTERMRLTFTTTGELSVNLDGNVIPVHKSQNGNTAPIVVVAVGDKRLEIPLGGSLDVYVL